jgi:hypothetical protein
MGRIRCNTNEKNDQQFTAIMNDEDNMPNLKVFDESRVASGLMTAAITSPLGGSGRRVTPVVTQGTIHWVPLACSQAFPCFPASVAKGASPPF